MAVHLMPIGKFIHFDMMECICKPYLTWDYKNERIVVVHQNPSEFPGKMRIKDA